MEVFQLVGAASGPFSPTGWPRAVSLGLLEPRPDGALSLHRLLAAFVRQEAGDALAAQAAVEQAALAEAKRNFRLVNTINH